MQHRPEIDGLRAVAVVPVILFHAGLSAFAGGFVGVDVFFVISGYLITGIIVAGQDKGRFTILGFYERRARRIIPALFVVMLCCLPFAWVWMLPAQMKSFGESIIAVCLFYSNVLFWQQSGYFAAAAELQPLLHTWSLAVEEQFYLVFPLVLMLIHRFGDRVRMAVVAGLAILSFLAAQFFLNGDPSGNFYLPFGRAWELFAGALVALVLLRHPQPRSSALSLLGLAMIALSVFLYDETTPFPSVYTLLPVIGTVLVVLCGGQGTATARLLSTPLLTGIGLISYSLYLWHQPLFAFARIRSLTEPSVWLMLGLAALSVPLAYLSWRFIETPVRTGRSGILASAPRILGATALSAAVLIAIGSFGRLDGGLAFRLPEEARLALAVEENPDPAMEACLFDKGQAKLDHPIKACRTPENGPIDTMLIGDSHAAGITGEALRAFSREGLNLYALSHSACVGFSGFVVSDKKYRERCNRFFTGIEAYIADAKIKTVIMLSRWSLYVDGNGFDNGEGGKEALKPTYVDLYDRRDAMGAQDDPARKKRVIDTYLADIRAYLDKGIDVVLVYPVPEAGWTVPNLLARAAMTGQTVEPLSTSAEVYAARNAAVIAAFDRLEHPRLRKVKPGSVFCDSLVKGRCVNSLSAGQIFYFDDDHLSNAGAGLLMPGIIDAVRSLKETAPAADAVSANTGF